MAQVQAVAGQFVRVAAGDQVEQRAAVGKAVEGRRLARRHGRRNDPRAQRDEELQALGDRDQRGGDQPGILAGTSGGNQHTAEAEAVGGLGDLLQVAVVDRAGALGGAKVVPVAVGGQEPEEVEAHRFNSNLSAPAWRSRAMKNFGNRLVVGAGHAREIAVAGMARSYRGISWRWRLSPAASTPHP
ncbi:hypothetical protein D9M70_526630 [compost metagenome]